MESKYPQFSHNMGHKSLTWANYIENTQFGVVIIFLKNTGCPRSNLAERIGYNLTRVDF